MYEDLLKKIKEQKSRVFLANNRRLVASAESLKLDALISDLKAFTEEIKAIPIIDYAARLGFTVIHKGKYYSLREHDSVMIDQYRNCFWRNSVFIKGYKGGAGSVIDFAIEFCHCTDVNAAIRELEDIYNVKGTRTANYTASHKQAAIHHADTDSAVKELELPLRADNNKAAIRYLCRERNIDYSVVKYFLHKKMLYEDERHNCVFSTQHFACIRSTGEKRFAIDANGCNYDECFYFKGSEGAHILVAAESVIDVMSIMTLFARENKRYTEYCYLSLSGTTKLPSLFYHLDHDTTIDSVITCFDNDKAGAIATETAIEGLLERGMNGRFSVMTPPKGKDWNDSIR